MKKICVLLAMLMLLVTIASAEQDFDLAELANVDFYFSSGAGAWFTQVNIAPDGQLTGIFADSDMGDSGEGYPNGTMYCSTFSGRVSVIGVEYPEAPFSWKLSLEGLTVEGTVGDEWIEDGVRYCCASPYGLENAEELILYLPGSPVTALPEGYLQWAHLNWLERQPENLPFYGLYNEADECGFVGEEYAEESAASGMG